MATTGTARGLLGATGAVALLLCGCSGGGSAANGLTGGGQSAASAHEFIADGGRIECDNAEVQGNLTEHLRIQHSDSAEQGTSCFVKGYTGWAPRQGECADLPEFTVHLNFGSYPTTAACSGEEPMELSPHPYRAQNGTLVNLGGATCRVVNPSVTCTSNASRGVSFTISPTKIYIPIAPGDSVRFGAGGLAANAQVRPPNLDISADSSFTVGHVIYRSWTHQSATGTGMLAVNSCQPDCAAGNYTNTQVKFTLDRPVLACGRFFFTRFSWRPASGGGRLSVFAFGPPSFQDADATVDCDVLLPPQT